MLPRPRHLRAPLLITALTLGCTDLEALNPVGSSTSTGADGPPAPSLAIAVAGAPRLWTGVLHVDVAATPAEAFFGVELRLGDTAVATDKTPPFAFDLDTTTIPDGPATLMATGILATSPDPITASLAGEIANTPPSLTLLSPTDGDVVRGPLSSGIPVAPIVKASDGNGIIAIWAQIGATTIDLGPADGSVPVPLPVGVDFPHPPISFEVHARDGSGMESVAKATVTPDVVSARFDAPVWSGEVAQLDILADGTLFTRVESPAAYPGGFFLVPKPDVPASMSLGHIPSFGPYALAGDGVIVRHYDASAGVVEIRRIVAPMSNTLLQSYTPQQGSYERAPSVLPSSGRVLVPWVDTAGAVTSHLRAFEPDGSPAWALDLPGVSLPNAVPGSGCITNTIEPAPGQLLALLGAAGALGLWLLPLDPATGAPGALWPSPCGRYFLTADAVSVLCTTLVGPNQQDLQITSVSASGVDWSFDVGPTGYPWPYVARQPDGSISTFVFGNGVNGSGSRWLNVGPKGVQQIWNAGQEVVLSRTPIPGTGAMLLRSFGAPPTRLFRVDPDGAVAWSVDMDAGSELILADGTIFAHAHFGQPPETIDLYGVSASGVVLWQDSLFGGNYKILGEVGARVFTSYKDNGDIVYEVRRGATGVVELRYREPTGGYTEPRVQFDPMWGHVIVINPPGDKVVSLIGLSL